MSYTVITGATGFVGTALVAALSDRALRLAVRTPYCENRVGMELAPVGEIDDRTDWSVALQGVSTVIHLAAHVHVMRANSSDLDLFHRVNVLGTERLAQAAARANVKRFIFLSSVKVNGEATYGRAFGANDVPRPVGAYGTSKLEAEQRLFAVAAATRMEAIAIRSPLVYGPGVGANFLQLLRLVERGWPLPLGDIRNQRSMVSVWNLCDLIKAVATASANRSQVLMVSDGEDISTSDLLRRLASAMRRPSRLWSVPPRALRWGGALFGKQGVVSRLCDSLTVDIGPTRRSFAWDPPISVTEGLERTARWYLDNRSNRRVRGTADRDGEDLGGHRNGAL